MNKINKVKVDDKIYEINTDFRVALECNKIAMDKTIGDYERALAIIYKLFGERGLDCQNQNKLFELAMRYISFGKEQKELKMHSHDNYEIDINKCEGLIRSSFKFDYNYDPYELEYLHWYDFYNDLSNLSTSEFGNCCSLNRVISILQTDTSNIKDATEKSKILNAKEELKRLYCMDEDIEMTKEQEQSSNEFYKSLGIEA